MGAITVDQYLDLQRLLKAGHQYRSEGELPDDVEDLDTICSRVLSGDPFDETAIEWRRIAAYEKELNGGSWPQRN
jgi:hypothetical protein|tara:strand:+ start:416 stop:640 length:225 start_codon:yes stop_codon:yes gene_type:complete